jgi:hypothetical protein
VATVRGRWRDTGGGARFDPAQGTAMSHRFAVALLAVSSCVGAVRSQGEVDARSTVAKGASVWLVHESVIHAKVAIGAQELATNERVAWTLHLRVLDVDGDGNYAVDTKVVRVRGKLSLAMGRGEAEFDSAGDADAAGAPEAREATAALTVAAGKTFRCKVSPRGEVLELGDGTKMLTDRTGHGGAMHETDDALLRQWVEGAFGVVPQRRTAAGAKWNRTARAAVGRMPTRQQLASTLTNVDPEFFEIESTGTVEIDLEAAVALDKEQGGHSIGQIESTKVTSGKLDAKQRTGRRDGFVLTADRTMKLEFETSDPTVGAMQAKCTMTLATRRTSEAEAMAKPDAKKGDTPPATGDGK